MIYFDNAATTIHKPETVVRAVAQALNSLGNAGRGAHEASLDASRNIYGVRERIADCLLYTSSCGSLGLCSEESHCDRRAFQAKIRHS